MLIFDVETSIRNHGNPFTKSNKLISYSYQTDSSPVKFKYFTDLDFITDLKRELAVVDLLIGFNLKFDLHWAMRYGCKLPKRCRVWDCQIAEFIISGQKAAYPSLAESLAKYGLGGKDDAVKEYWDAGVDTEFIPYTTLETYNNLDVTQTYALYLEQQKVMTDKQKRLCIVMCLDLLVLQEMEYNGVEFNVELCKVKGEETATRLKTITDELLGYCPSPDLNLDSGQQLSCLLFGGKYEVDTLTQETAYYKGNSKATGAKKGDAYQKTVHNITVYECPQLFIPIPKTETKLKKKLGDEEITIYETNEDVLKKLKKRTPFQKKIIELLLERSELAKLMDTYYGKLPAMLNEMEWGSAIHGQYNQCVAATGRLSSSKPNMQNFSGDVDKLLISRYND